jgi:hypothetical protein
MAARGSVGVPYLTTARKKLLFAQMGAVNIVYFSSLLNRLSDHHLGTVQIGSTDKIPCAQAALK